MRSDNQNAFSLTELLVSIGVLAILIGMLFPVLNGIKNAGEEAKCAANLRQIGVGFRGYIDDHNGYAPPHWGQPFFDPSLSPYYLWTGYLAPYLNLDPQGELSKIFDCPDDPDLKKRPPSRGYTSVADNFAISYGFNYWTLSSQKNWNSNPVNLRTVGNMTSLILAADSLPVSKSGTLIALIDFSSSVASRGPDFRHNGHANAVFLDGHVESVSPSTVKNYKYWAPVQ